MKRALIAAGIIAFLAFTIAGYETYQHFHEIFGNLSRARQVPANLQQARIVTGSSALDKSIDFSSSNLGLVTDIEPRPGNSLLLVGQEGALTLTADHSTHSTVHFPTCFGPIIATQLGDGTFFCRSDLMSGPKLIDSIGNSLWVYKDDSIGSSADDASPGELGPAHAPVVAVGMNGDGGVRLLDANGKELWRQPDGNVWHIEIAPTPTGNVIVHSNAGGELTLRDINGKILLHCNPEIYLAHFSLTSWSGDPQPNHLIAAAQGAFYVIALDGTTTAKFPAPLLQSDTDDAYGIPLLFTTAPAGYAVLVNHKLWSRSLLYIYDSARNPIYTEILGQDCASLQTVPQPDGTQALLVGCKNQLLRYTAASHPS